MILTNKKHGKFAGGFKKILTDKRDIMESSSLLWTLWPALDTRNCSGHSEATMEAVDESSE